MLAEGYMGEWQQDPTGGRPVNVVRLQGDASQRPVKDDIHRYPAHFYVCRNCGTGYYYPDKAVYGDPFRCRLDGSWLKFTGTYWRNKATPYP